MRYARPATLAAIILVAQTGCRTAGVDNLARQAPLAAKPQLDAQSIIAEHNRNAGQIETIQAHPSLVVNKGLKNYAVDGRLALERPRNFRLEMSHTTGDVADIGSNDEKFWFWIKDNQQKKVFYCNYDESGNTPLPASTLQPDWIVEALGLRVIPDSEAAGFTVTRGRAPDTLVLTHRPTRTGQDTVTRVTVVSESTHRIREHQLLAGEPKKLLARAVVTEYMELSPVDRPDEVVYLPKKLKLDWVVDKMSLDVTFNPTSTKINSDLSQKHALFEQDERTGYELEDLAAGFRTQKDQTTLRETMPAPPTGIKLGEPAPIGVDGAMLTDQDPVALSAERTSSLRDDLLGPALPSAPGSDFAKPVVSSRWRASSTYER
jgi:outer membrane lipoprotein-sorting protein